MGIEVEGNEREGNLFTENQSERIEWKGKTEDKKELQDWSNRGANTKRRTLVGLEWADLMIILPLPLPSTQQ